jgi:hypothetical protein
LAGVVDHAAAALLLVRDATQAGRVTMRALDAFVLADISSQLTAATSTVLFDAEGALSVAMLLLWTNVEATSPSIHSAGSRLLVGHAGTAVFGAALVVRAVIKAFVATHLTVTLRLIRQDAVNATRVANKACIAAVVTKVTLDHATSVTRRLVLYAGSAVFITLEALRAGFTTLVAVDDLTDIARLGDWNTVVAFGVAPLPGRAGVLTNAARVLADTRLSRLAGSTGRVTGLSVGAGVAALVIKHLALGDIALANAVGAIRCAELSRGAFIDAATFSVHVTTWVFRLAMLTTLIADLTIGAEVLAETVDVHLAGVEVLSFAGAAAGVAMLAFGAVVLANTIDDAAFTCRLIRPAVVAIFRAMLTFGAKITTNVAFHDA